MFSKRNPTEQDVRDVVATLRGREINEIELLLQSPTHVAMTSVKNSQNCHAIMFDFDKPIALCGVVDYQGTTKTGLVWIMTSVEAYKYPIAFYKEVKKLVDHYETQYERLFNYVAVEAVEHQWFIDSLGFDITKQVYKNETTGQEYYMFEYISARWLEKLYKIGAKHG